MTAVPDTTTRPDGLGLTSAEVAERVERGDVNRLPDHTSRSVRDIVRANVVTRFNLLLGSLLVVILIVAPIQDALFGLVLVVNTAIGIIQEVRAKRTLDRLALLTSPRIEAVRDGAVRQIGLEDVVLDDLLKLSPGDQVVVDAEVVTSAGLEVDESLLTGEADPVHKQRGDELLSGSFVVAGNGSCRATRVGADAYATQLAAEARRFTLVHSELRAGVDWLLKLIGWLLVPTIPLLVWSQLRATPGLEGAIAGAVAGSVAMIPQGLVLLTSVAFAVGVLRLGRRSVLVQELPAVEGLARVDTVCFDKTGTLTEGRLQVRDLEILTGRDSGGATRHGGEIERVLGALAAVDPTPNATLAAVAARFPAPEGWDPVDVVAFSSARKWSGARFVGRGAFALGAPDVLVDEEGLLDAAEQHAAEGRRVLVVGAAADEELSEEYPPEITPLALVVLGDAVRADAAETVAYFLEQGVTPKVISGDHPRTVGAIAAQAGVPGAEDAVDARNLPDDPDELADLVEQASVFGRVSPHQKRAMVGALQARGHVVAMTGDGVNDVLALKDANIGMAMGGGSAAARSVAQLVLIDGNFDTMPDIVAEGRRVTSNIERVSNLFVTKTVYAFLLAVAIGAAGLVFPFLPRHLTLVGSLTIGIPSFFLALEATSRRYRPGFVKRVLRFALPTGAVAATATFAAYWLAQQEQSDLVGSRTIATLVLGAVGVFALVMICRPWTPLRRTVVGSVVAGFVLVFLLPPAREFFALDPPRAVVFLAAIGIVAITGSILTMALHLGGWIRHTTLEDVTELTSQAVSRSRKVLEAAAARLRDRSGRPG